MTDREDNFNFCRPPWGRKIFLSLRSRMRAPISIFVILTLGKDSFYRRYIPIWCDKKPCAKYCWMGENQERAFTLLKADYLISDSEFDISSGWIRRCLKWQWMWSLLVWFEVPTIKILLRNVWNEFHLERLYSLYLSHRLRITMPYYNEPYSRTVLRIWNICPNMNNFNNRC